MKKRSNIQIKEEASVFRLLYTLIVSHVPVAAAFEIVADSIKSFNKPLMGITHDFCEAGSTRLIGAAFERQAEHFSGFVPELFSHVEDDAEITEVCWEVARIIGRASRLLRSGANPEEIDYVNFFRVFSTMVRRGPNTIEGLRLSGAQCLGPEDVVKLVGSVDEGETISAGMKATGQFSDREIGMMLVGEETGTVSELCDFLADVGEQELFLEAQPRTVISEQSRMISLESLFEVRHLAVLVDVGLPICSVLNCLARDMPDESRRHVYQLLKGKIKGSVTLSEAMAAREFSREFPSYVVTLVRVGEERVELEMVLRRLVEFINWELFDEEPKQEELSEK